METEDQDWFYDSIKRYKNLNMFELENPIQQVEPVDSSSICVTSSNSKSHQLVELSLPLKLLSRSRGPSDKTITSDTDMKIKCGTFTEASCFQIKTIANQRKVIASHTGKKGVTLYSLSSDSDKIKKETCIDCHLESPMIATNESNLWLTRKRDEQTLLFDLNTEKCLQTFRIDEKNSTFECDERIVPMFVGHYVVAFGRQVTGGVYFADCRMPLDLWNVDYSQDLRNESNFWSFASLYDCSKEFVDTAQNICFAKVSKTGTLLVYDSRNTRLPAYMNKNLGLKTEKSAPLQVRFKPNNKDCVSVSGFDGNVYVYELHKEQDPKLVFTHDGHKHVEGYSSSTVVTSHLWSILDNLVISSADNGTVQMWQFENKDMESS